MTTPRRGAALLEVLVGLAILALSGTALVSAVSEAIHREREVLQREQELVAMERVLAATTLLTRDELSRRLGDRAVGEFAVSVARPAAELFEIRIRPQGSQQGGLATLVFRAELPRAP